MKLARIRHEGEEISVIIDNGVAYTPAALFGRVPLDWRELVAFLHQRMKEGASTWEIPEGASAISLDNVAYGIPAEASTKIICVGLNYRDHALEGNQPIPEHPVYFIRYLSSFVAQHGELAMPKVSTRYDYEAELVIVIGETLQRPTKEQAKRAIFGYTAAMDGSVRDYQKRTPQWTLGKNFDRSGAIGPSIVTADALPRIESGLQVQARVNGTLLQDGSTSDMIFPVETLVASLAECMTLHPGDMILTGTPAGVGFARTPPVYLKPGDQVSVSISGLETLDNTVV